MTLLVDVLREVVRRMGALGVAADARRRLTSGQLVPQRDAQSRLRVALEDAVAEVTCIGTNVVDEDLKQLEVSLLGAGNRAAASAVHATRVKATMRLTSAVRELDALSRMLREAGVSRVVA